MQIIQQNERDIGLMQENLKTECENQRKIKSLKRLTEDQELGIEAAIQQEDMAMKQLINKEV